VNKLAVDINADVGEGIGNENQLMPFLSSCNIACGGHAGDRETMEHVSRLAANFGVKIGAHPSFPDKENFGRVAINIGNESLFVSLLDQIHDLMTILMKNNLNIHHVKPHGALYNLAAENRNTASVIVKVMKQLPSHIKLYVPYKSIIADLAIENKIPIVYEAFADRNYNDDLTLVSRNNKNALIHDVNTMFKNVYNIISKQKIESISGKEIDIKAQTVCIHGDNPEAVVLLKSLISQLKDNGVSVL